MAPDLQAPASVTVPSADLINYRFDQTDKRFAEMGTKLDQILLQNSNFVTEEHAEKLVAEAVKPLNDTLNNWRWYWRALFSAMILALGTAVVSILIRKG